MDGDDDLGVNEVVSGRMITILRNKVSGSVFKKVDPRDLNISQEDRYSSVCRNEPHGALLDGLKWSLDWHSQMKKLHNEEGAQRANAFIEWKAQRHQERLALDDEIGYHMEALQEWKEIVK